MIRFSSINIEGDTHLDKVVSFLNDFKPDVVCMQEVMETRLDYFEKALNMKGYFVPMARYNIVPLDKKSSISCFGVGIFSNLQMLNVESKYYYGGEGDIPLLKFDGKNIDEKSVWRVLISGNVSKDNELYTIATTHFTRTYDGSTSDKQREDLKNLLKITEKKPEIILCGDFNAPRGQEIFSKLSEKYKDNIPPEYTSSLDTELHRIGKVKQLMVDGLFTTPHYEVTEARLSEGVSDHKAVTAIISKVK